MATRVVGRQVGRKILLIVNHRAILAAFLSYLALLSGVYSV